MLKNLKLSSIPLNDKIIHYTTMCIKCYKVLCYGIEILKITQVIEML